MSEYQPFAICNFDELVDAVRNIPLKDQKDLAEDILVRFYEDGWDINVSNNGEVNLSKTETL